MLTNVNLPFYCKHSYGALNVISWKYTFKRLNEEYEIAKKKKQALDNLFTKQAKSRKPHATHSLAILMQQ